MSEEKFIKTICLILKIIAWGFLIFGIIFALAVSTALYSLALVSRWAGVSALLFFILVFLFINLVVKIAEMVLGIKKKIEA